MTGNTEGAKQGSGESDSPLPATAEQALRWRTNPMLLQARFPSDLTDPTTMAQFIQVCIAVDLNPLMGEIVPIHGRPYITEEGWLRMIDERAPGQLVKDETSMASPEEAEGFGVHGGWLGKAVVTRRILTLDGKTTADRVVTDYFFLSADTVNNSISAIKDEPWRHAMKGAHVRALRKAFRDVVARAASDFNLGGGGDEENIIDVETVRQVERLATAGAEEDTLATERKKFWARAPKLGLKHGSETLAAFFSIPPGSSINQEWIDKGNTWMQANLMLDRYEEEGPCIQCGGGWVETEAYTPEGKPLCSSRCLEAFDVAQEPSNDNSPKTQSGGTGTKTTKRPRRSSSAKRGGS